MAIGINDDCTGAKVIQLDSNDFKEFQRGVNALKSVANICETKFPVSIFLTPWGRDGVGGGAKRDYPAFK